MPASNSLGPSASWFAVLVGLYLGATCLWWSVFYLVDPGNRSTFGGAFIIAGIYTSLYGIIYFGLASVVAAALWLRFVYQPRVIPTAVAVVVGMLAMLLPLLVLVGRAPFDQLELQSGAQLLFIAAVAVCFAGRRRVA